MMINRALQLLLGILLLTNSACMGVKRTTSIRVFSDEYLNATDNGVSLPVVIRVYQLNNETPFVQASFEELWKKDKEILGNSFLSRHEYTVYPNKIETFSFNTKEESHYIGFFATFRKPSRESWRKIMKTPPGFRPRPIGVTLKNNELR